MDKEFLKIDSSPSGTVLIVGDGDYSFSVAFAKRYNHVDLTATTLEETELMTAKYPHFEDNVSNLSKMGKCIQTIHTLY